MGMRNLVVIAVLSTAIWSQEIPPDVADIPCEDRHVAKQRDMRYFLIGPKKSAEPAPRLGLILVMPGGRGGADFNSFVRRIFKHSVPEGYLVAQLVAPKWTSSQKIVWPTAKSKVPKMKFTTEDFVEAVIKDVARKQRLDAARIFTLSWSSSGPAAYRIALTSKTVKGSFIAMSVYKPDQLPPLRAARGRAFYLYHSPVDERCPYRMAEKASEELSKAGAQVKLFDYGGGHGWRGPMYRDIKNGLKWLAARTRKKR